MARVSIGRFEFRCGEDRETGQFVLNAGWHRQRQTEVTAGLPPVLRGKAEISPYQSRPSYQLPTDLREEDNPRDQMPATPGQIRYFLANCSPAELRAIRWAAIWRSEAKDCYKVAIICTGILLGLAVAFPILLTVVGFIAKGFAANWAGAFAEVAPVTMRALLIFTTLHIVAREFSLRRAEIPTDKYAFAKIWDKAFKTDVA